MSSFQTEIKIRAPVSEVWKVLADIGTISHWNPGVVSSNVTTDEVEGVSVRRHCALGGGNYLDEEVVDWKIGKRLTMRIIGTNLPFKTADIRFTLHADNSETVVTVSPEYTIKFGLLGTVLDLLFVRRTYVKGMKRLLVGLKSHIESER